MSRHQDQVEKVETESVVSAQEKLTKDGRNEIQRNCEHSGDARKNASSSSAAPTLPSQHACSHEDMAGDTLIEVIGPYHRCTSCCASWTDKELVIVNDEPAAA